MSGEFAVAILNRSQQEQPFAFNVDTIGLDASKGYTAKNLWSKKEFAISTKNKIDCLVAPHGVVVLQLSGTAMPFNFFQFADRK